MLSFEFKANADQGTGVYLLEAATNNVIYVPNDATELLDDTQRTRLKSADEIGNSGANNALNFVEAIPG